MFQSSPLLLQALPQVMLLLPLILAGGDVPDGQVDGTIDDVHIYSPAPSSSEIQTIYNSGTIPPLPSSTKFVMGNRIRVSSRLLRSTPSTGGTS